MNDPLLDTLDAARAAEEQRLTVTACALSYGLEARRAAATRRVRKQRAHAFDLGRLRLIQGRRHP